MSAQRIFVVLLCIFALGADKRKPITGVPPAAGAWLQVDLKWHPAPTFAKPRQRSSTAVILYFGKDHSFAQMLCVVNQVPGEYTAISNPDGAVLFRGRWERDKREIAVSYQFVFVPPRPRPEGPTVSQPIQHATIHRSHDLLEFGETKFKREPQLDDDAHKAVLTSTRAIATPLR